MSSPWRYWPPSFCFLSLRCDRLPHVLYLFYADVRRQCLPGPTASCRGKPARSQCQLQQHHLADTLCVCDRASSSSSWLLSGKSGSSIRCAICMTPSPSHRQSFSPTQSARYAHGLKHTDVHALVAAARNTADNTAELGMLQSHKAVKVCAAASPKAGLIAARVHV